MTKSGLVGMKRLEGCKFRAMIMLQIMPWHDHRTSKGRVDVTTLPLAVMNALQWLNVSYSVWFKPRHNRSGNLFQGSFKSLIVEDDAISILLEWQGTQNPLS